jgi:hypothetical protein
VATAQQKPTAKSNKANEKSPQFPRTFNLLYQFAFFGFAKHKILVVQSL